jgi:hypothetical protein
MASYCKPIQELAIRALRPKKESPTMRTSLLIAAVGTLAFGSGSGIAQSQGGPPAGAINPPTADMGNSSSLGRNNRDQLSEYDKAISNLDKPKPAKRKPKAVAATAADIAPGAAIRDVNGQPIGKVDSLAADGVIVDTGQAKISLPLESIGKDDVGLLIAITARKFGEIVAQASDSRAPKPKQL